jgi:hypothetical protein
MLAPAMRRDPRVSQTFERRTGGLRTISLFEVTGFYLWNQRREHRASSRESAGDHGDALPTYHRRSPELDPCLEPELRNCRAFAVAREPVRAGASSMLFGHRRVARNTEGRRKPECFDFEVGRIYNLR